MKFVGSVLFFFFAFMGIAFAQETTTPVVDPSGVEAILKMALDFLAGTFDLAKVALAVVAGLIVVGRVYIAMTPTKSDDQWLQELEKKPWIGMVLRVVAAFSPVQRK
jgi:hypothetical protein